MCCNWARGEYFSAGNSTTNRIEANWNQVKQLLDKKCRIDMSVAGLLNHPGRDSAVQLSHPVTFYKIKNTRPDFVVLTHCGWKIEGDFALSKVLSQWDNLLTNFQNSASSYQPIPMRHGYGKLWLTSQNLNVTITNGVFMHIFNKHKASLQHLVFVPSAEETFRDVPVRRHS